MKKYNPGTQKKGQAEGEVGQFHFSVPESLSQSTYLYLENMIVSGRMEPGERLLPDEIANMLKVSRSPVREALFRLEKDGLVTNFPRLGFFVSEVNIDDIEEIYPVRMALYSVLIKSIVEKGYDSDFMDTVDGYIKKMTECVKNGDIDSYFSLSVALYNCYAACCTNFRLKSIMDQVQKAVLRFRALGLTPPGRIKRSYELNRALAKAIKDKNSSAAGDLAEKLVYEGLVALRKLLMKKS
jgi:DNA-binding GntR family transcriptional regulator